MEHALKNCSWHKQPFASYDEAVQGLYAPELLKRFHEKDRVAQLAKLNARDYGQALDNVREALGQKETHYLIISDNVRIAIKALEGYASNSLEKKDSTRAKVALAMIRGKTLNATCEACGEKLVVVEEEGVPAIFCADCGGGCVSWSREEMMP